MKEKPRPHKARAGHPGKKKETKERKKKRKKKSRPADCVGINSGRLRECGVERRHTRIHLLTCVRLSPYARCSRPHETFRGRVSCRLIFRMPGIPESGLLTKLFRCCLIWRWRC